MFARSLRPVLRAVLPRSEKNCRVRAYHEEPAHLKPSTMDDLPMPQGSWQTDFNERQKKYNMQLIAGVLSLAGTLIVMKASGLFNLYMSPPELPKE